MAALFVRETPHVHSEIYLFPRVYHEVLFTMYHPLFLQSVENERKRPARTLRAFVIQHLTNQGTPLMPRDGTRGNLPSTVRWLQQKPSVQPISLLGSL